jgi:hypothetical protein
MLTSDRNAYTSKKHADLEILCQGRVWKVHKLVVSAHSDVLRETCEAGKWEVCSLNHHKYPLDLNC